jgi:putative nucleotidyltransferase with HDIG domain
MLPPLAGYRVLVVDDERAIAAAVARRLERGGAVCTAVHSGSEAEALLATAAHDLLLSDVQMPGRSGLELLDAAAQLVDAPAVILMAADGDLAAATEGLRRGADGCVRKPLDLELLAHEVGVVLELRQLRQMVEAATTGRAAGPALLILGEIVNAFERADPFRAGFSSRTARLASALAAPLGLNKELLVLAARVHDVGMLAVPVTEQHAEGPLARPAQHLVRVHPTLGARWVERLGADRAVVAAVAAHHERWDGGGYPGGLAGEAIPPMARALGTAAAIAAMTGPRPWRDKREVDRVIAELRKGRLTQFGATEVDAAVEILGRLPELAR